MMAPWEVWGAQIDQDAAELVLIVSSEFHIRTNVSRIVTVLPVTDEWLDLNYRIPVRRDNEQLWVVTDQIRTISAVMHPTGWTLADDEIRDVRNVLKHMVAF